MYIAKEEDYNQKIINSLIYNNYPFNIWLYVVPRCIKP